ncbi:MAG: hypothetical protein IJN11_06920 [Oscillospiraceae bacterium]|nr:hypothetical protein [Oscillospiraceae bacterium]
MSVFKKAAAFVTAISMAAAMTACSDTTYGMVIDDYTVPAGIYIYYANSAYSEAVSKIAEEKPDLDTSDAEALKETVKAETIEGMDSLTWIQNKAVELCANYVAVEKKFDELELELDEETELNLDYMVEYYWASYQASMEENGVSEDSFRKIMTSSYKSEMIFEHYYGIDGENGVTEDELKTYYIENNIRTQYVAFNLVDGEGNMLKSDGKEEMMDMVEDYQERVESAYDEGGVEAVMTEMNLVQDEYKAYCTSISEEAAGVTVAAAETTTTAEETTTEETTTETTAETETGTEETTTAAVETDENGSTVSETAAETEETTTAASDEEGDASDETTTTISYTNEKIVAVINEEDYEEGDTIPYSPCEEVYKKLISITDKDYGKPYIVEDDEVYYLVVRYEIEDRMTEEDLWNESQIYNVEVAKYGEDFDKYLEEWTAALTIQKNEAAIKRYDPFKFTF